MGIQMDTFGFLGYVLDHWRREINLIFFRILSVLWVGTAAIASGYFHSTWLQQLTKGNASGLSGKTSSYIVGHFSKRCQSSLQQKGIAMLTFHSGEDPVQKDSHPCINSWFLWPGTSYTPADNAVEGKQWILILTNQWTTWIPLRDRHTHMGWIVSCISKRHIYTAATYYLG